MNIVVVADIFRYELLHQLLPAEENLVVVVVPPHQRADVSTLLQR